MKNNRKHIGKMRSPRSHPEDDLQRAVAQLLDMVGWQFWHTPNGGYRGRTEAARFRGLGVKAGVADIIISEPWVMGDESGTEVAIELKSKNGKLTARQRAWLEAQRVRGWLCVVCRSLDEVLAVLQLVRPVNGRHLQPPSGVSSAFDARQPTIEGLE